MALIVFRSRASSEIIMFARDAEALLLIAGKVPGERGVIPTGEIAQVLQKLQHAVAEDRESAEESGDAPVPVGLRQRAFPLMQMLAAAQKRHVDVTWGI